VAEWEKPFREKHPDHGGLGCIGSNLAIRLVDAGAITF
jgi:hypothetical protein